ncbi:putative late blight resistance protein homolog R1A-10 isoform X2 [Solanum stenotomum]|uniref:putative late blight resistance protein homolog R1A-10 isoform X2 n=1 Tax=Solanum stenotomum TaxID=172797 RepID=UPI0020D05C6E|nr:putative late blight resistance protein homolog R1A-10 isoform X2 [Solanum stenotomum]
MWTKSLSLRNKNNIAERLNLQSLLSFTHSNNQREMAYAALSSLMYTLEQLFKPNQYFVCPSYTQQHVQSLYQNLSALQLFLDNTTTKDIETLKFIEKRIRDVIYKAEDKVDLSLRSIILADCTESREGACKFFEEELVQVEKDVDSLRQEVMQIEFNKHGSKSAVTLSSPEKSAIEENSIVGMEDDFNTILDRFTAQTDELPVIPIFGMGGIGKTTLARKVYDDSYIRSRFDKQAWVTISQEYNERQMLLELVSSITGSKQETSDDELMEIVYRGLKGRRFLIVIDDIWSTEAWDQIQRIFPKDNNKSRILLTTRLKYVADYVNNPDFPPHSKSFLSLEDSWSLFTKKIFIKDHCPPLLEEIGKHIVQQCQGLPLSIVVVAGLLVKMDLTHDNWKEVEENLDSFFGTVSERCQSILSLSYNYLPQYLRACFLYIGGFPEDREISVSKLIRLWIAEQFVKARNNKRLEVVAEEYLQELIDRSLILTGTQRVNERMKTYKIHDLLRQLCLSETHTENVVHIMNGNVPMFLLEAIDDQRRVIVLSKLEEKQVYPPMHSNGITSTARTFMSMKYFSYSDFPKGICSIVSEFKLLKVLDVLTFWLDFSSVIPELVHLRYVAANIEEALSLDKLRNLQTIILQRNIGVNRPTALEQPLDIWRMSELRHVDIDSSLYISNPLEAENPLFLNNLQSLYLYNSPFIVEIIRRTPNLKELKLLIDGSDHPDWPGIFDSLILLEDLEILHIRLESIGLNIFSGDILSCKIKKLSPNIKKLILSRTYIPWEVVNLLANLPNLEVIEGEYAFSGTDWKVDEDVVFHKLKYLLIGEADLERWEVAAGSDNFPMLERLILYGLKKLEEIPESIGDIMTLKLIQIKRCCSSVVNSAKRIQQEQESLGNYELQLRIIPKVFSESRIVEYNITQKEISPGNKEILIENKQYYKFLGKDIHMVSLIKLYTEGGKVVRHEDCWDKKPLRNRETVKVPLVGCMIEVSRRASMLLTHALMGFGKDPSM